MEMEIQININRSGVLHVVEGLTATMAQHNGGAPTFEELWASASESKKLDIWWRDGILDLEENLMKWAKSTSQQYDLKADGEDYVLNLTLNDRWSDRLTGLLANKIQYYLAHVTMAGWLNDFPQVTGVNYTELAANDIKSVLNILLCRQLDFEEAEKREDSRKGGDDEGQETSERRSDSRKGGDDEGQETSERRSDSRKGDDSEGANGVVSRDKDDEMGGMCCCGTAAHKTRDNDDVTIRRGKREEEWIDYNGAGIMLREDEGRGKRCGRRDCCDTAIY